MAALGQIVKHIPAKLIEKTEGQAHNPNALLSMLELARALARRQDGERWNAMNPAGFRQGPPVDADTGSKYEVLCHLRKHAGIYSSNELNRQTAISICYKQKRILFLSVKTII